MRDGFSIKYGSGLGMHLFLAGLIMCVLTLAACSSSGPASKDELKTAENEIQFFDSGSFDRKLSFTLAKNTPEATVIFAAPVSLNNIPERLDQWFSHVEEDGGTVTLEMEPGTDETARGVVSEALSLLVGVYEMVADKIIYGPVADYNAIVYYRGDTGTLTRVVFVYKPKNQE